MDFLLYHPKAADVTGPALARELGIRHGTTLDEQVDILIRYGSIKSAPQPNKRAINTSEAISRAVDKRGSLATFLEHGILAPAPSPVPHSLPAIGRKMRHESGSGFWLCLQAMDVTNAMNNGAEYFVPYIPTRAEYRVHVFCGQALLMQKKTLRKKKTPMWPWMRNNRTGWGLDQVDMIPEICNLGVTAVRSLGLDFGATDIIESDKGYLYVLEVNTAPALREERLQIWSEALRRILCAE